VNASQYELLKCDGCGKKLGYIHISIKIYPSERWIHLVTGGPIKKIEKTVFCEDCFLRRKTEIAKCEYVNSLFTRRFLFRLQIFIVGLCLLNWILNTSSRDGMQQDDAFQHSLRQVPRWDICQKPLDNVDGNGSPAVC